MEDLFQVEKKYVSKAEEKSGCDLCQLNIHIGETYYKVIDYDGVVLLTACELCKPKLIKKLEG